ncbi:hypothetical protein ACA910_015151 [Epithemia clementina (nom. ined.)]
MESISVHGFSTTTTNSVNGRTATPVRSSANLKSTSAVADFSALCSSPRPAYGAEENDDNQVATSPPSLQSRRQALSCVAMATLGLVSSPQPSQATYSAYTRREQDWDERQKNGEVQYSSARELRQQLREIVPQNSEKSRIFCPNGPSAAVSPLMENKCGDRMAMPSVYGRSNDAVGNSIPGFSSEWKSTYVIADSVGGFPTYDGTKGSSRK